MSAQEPACRACGARQWVTVSLNGGLSCVSQCVPCGAIAHAPGGTLRAAEIPAGQISTHDLTKPLPPDPQGAPYLASLGYGPPAPLAGSRCRPRVRLS